MRFYGINIEYNDEPCFESQIETDKLIVLLSFSYFSLDYHSVAFIILSFGYR